MTRPTRAVRAAAIVAMLLVATPADGTAPPLPATALARLNASAARARANHDTEMLGVLSLRIGLAKAQVNDFAGALSSVAQAVGFDRQHAHRRSEADAFEQIGDAASRHGRRDLAVRGYAAALDILIHLKDLRRQARALDRIGTFEAARGRNDAAMHAYERSEQTYRRINDAADETAVFRDAGRLMLSLGRYETALLIFVQALDVDEHLAHSAQTARDLGDLGAVSFRLGFVALAIRLDQQALAIDRRRKNATGESADLAGLGVAESSAGQFGAALDTAHQALAIHRRLKALSGEANDWNNIGTAEMGLAQLDAAYQALHTSLVMHRQLKNKLGEARNLVNLGAVELRRGNDAQALSDGRRAQSLAAAIAAPEPLWRALSVCAAAEAHLDRRDAALADYDATLTQLDAMRSQVAESDRSNFLSGKLFVYDRYMAYLVDLDRRFPGQGFDRRAFEVLERKESRALLEQIGGSAAERFKGVPASVVTEEKRSLAALAAAGNDLMASDPAKLATARHLMQTAVAQRAAFERRVKSMYPEYYALLHPQPETVDDVQRGLRDDEALLSYDLLPATSVLFVLTHDRLAMVPLAGSAALSASATRLRSHMQRLVDDVNGGLLTPEAIAGDAADDLPGFRADSHVLATQLLPPSITPLLTGKKLIIVPSGPLYDVPWEALVTQVAGSAPRYLLDDHAVSYIPSGSLLTLVRRANRESNPQRATLLAFANPAFDNAEAAAGDALAQLQYAALRDDSGGRFRALPGTALEADGVRKALAADADSVISGESATKARLLELNQHHQLANYRYLLFATHAVLPNTEPGVNQPALVFAHQAHDGFLTMAEVFNLSLDADFVALSACNTGNGNGSRLPGEGISGMTRAFLYAGTPAISVTLWEIDDLAAPLITPAFFAGMESGLSAADALRAAKLKLAHSSDARLQHPYAWAPTVIFGDGTTPRADRLGALAR